MSLLNHTEKYVGSHAYTDDFAFQDQIRTSDLAIKAKLKSFL